ncbi:MAG: homoaconitate hydratase, partial [Candidatus Aminicenantes bacterium]|nr:homoaconitate hydratase [Candidatus Aminicenantes bacterium]
VAGVICAAADIPAKAVLFTSGPPTAVPAAKRSPAKAVAAGAKPTVVRGRVWVIDKDNIDTDMIFHNRYLAITDVALMGRYTFDNLAGWEDFAAKSSLGDIVVTASNFGAGSSRQQAVDCFKSLGVRAIIARSFGAIYERNAVNAGLPVLTGDLLSSGLRSGEEITVDFATGDVTRAATGEVIRVAPFSEIQMAIYRRGGLFGEG